MAKISESAICGKKFWSRWPVLSTSISARQFMCAFIFQNHSVIEAESLKTWIRWGHNRATMRACMHVHRVVYREVAEWIGLYRPALISRCCALLSCHSTAAYLQVQTDLLLTSGTPLQQLMDLNSQQRNNRQQQQHSREGTKRVRS